MKQLLPQNALSTITLDRLVAGPNSRRTYVSAELQRVAIPEDLVNPLEAENKTKGDPDYLEDLVPRPPSGLPPARQQRLRASLGHRLGYGRSSVVYALDDVTIPDLENGTVIPPLVVKIARRDRVAWLAREAWFYEELECFQGSVVPYCFGWFEMELPKNGLSNTLASPQAYTVPALDGRHRQLRDETDDEEDEEPSELKYYEGRQIHPLLLDRDRRRDIISVLVLERLGGMLPLRQKVDKKSGPGEEIYSMFGELAELGIIPWDDVRRENMLQALPLPCGISPPKSFIRQRTYGWRLIDFERFMKCDHTPLGCQAVYGPQCVQTLVNVSEGYGHDYDSISDSDSDTDSESGESQSEEFC